MPCRRPAVPLGCRGRPRPRLPAHWRGDPALQQVRSLAFGRLRAARRRQRAFPPRRSRCPPPQQRSASTRPEPRTLYSLTSDSVQPQGSMEVRSTAVTPPPSWRGQPQHLPPASADDLPSQLPPPLSLLSEPEGPTSLRSRSDSPTTSTHNASTQTATRRVAVSSRGALTAAADRVTLPPPDAPQQGVVDARVYLTARPWSPRHSAGKREPQRARMRAQPVAECDDEQASAPDMRQPELKAVALARSPVPVVSMQQHQSGQGTSVSLSDQTPPRAAATRVAAAPPVVPPNAALPPRSASSSSQERDATARGSRGDIGRMPPPRIPSLGLRRTLEPPSSDGAAAQARAPGDATAGAASPGRVSPEASPGRTSATFPPSSPIAQLAPLPRARPAPDGGPARGPAGGVVSRWGSPG